MFYEYKVVFMDISYVKTMFEAYYFQTATRPGYKLFCAAVYSPII